MRHRPLAAITLALAILALAILALAIPSLRPAFAFQCAIPGETDEETIEWALGEADAIFEVVVYSIWRDDTFEQTDEWTGTAVYGRAVVTRTLRGNPPSEVLIGGVRTICEGCPNVAHDMFQSLQDKAPMLVVSRKPKRVGSAAIFSHNACLEEALSFAGWLQRNIPAAGRAR